MDFHILRTLSEAYQRRIIKKDNELMKRMNGLQICEELIVRKIAADKAKAKMKDRYPGDRQERYQNAISFIDPQKLREMPMLMENYLIHSDESNLEINEKYVDILIDLQMQIEFRDVAHGAGKKDYHQEHKRPLFFPEKYH